MIVRLEFSGDRTAIVLEAQAPGEDAILKTISHYSGATVAAATNWEDQVRYYGALEDRPIKKVTITLGHVPKDPLPKPLNREVIDAMLATPATPS